MKERIIAAIKVILMLGICIAGITYMYRLEGKSTIPTDTIAQPADTVTPSPSFMSMSAEDGLFEALDFYGIHHPEVVYAQAVLETGHFKSKLCIDHNNLFGLYNSKAKEYYKFSHWTESVEAYQKWIQYKYKSPEDYYEFLNRIHYAEDPSYISKLKQIARKYYDKRGYIERDSGPKGV